MPDGRRPEPGGWNRIILPSEHLEKDVETLKRPECISETRLSADREAERSCWMIRLEIQWSCLRQLNDMPLRAMRFGPASYALWHCDEQSLVARKGSAPPISVCRPDVMLFHDPAKVACRAAAQKSKGLCSALQIWREMLNGLRVGLIFGFFSPAAWPISNYPSQNVL